MALNLPTFSSGLADHSPRKSRRSTAGQPTAATTLPPQYVEILMDLAEVEAAQVLPEARFKEELGLDSLDMVELVMMCEKEFQVTLMDPDWMQARTVGALGEVLKRKLQTRPLPPMQ